MLTLASWGSTPILSNFAAFLSPCLSELFLLDHYLKKVTSA